MDPMIADSVEKENSSESPAASASRLVDRFGRAHTSLRVSVTDRCNIRCTYCMPSEQVQFMPRPWLLSFEELTRVVRVFCGIGIRKLRLTGGEPLVRRGLPDLIRELRRIPQVDEIAMTTNAILLGEHAEALKAAGLDRLNISLDTLDSQQFLKIARRDELPATLEGIAAAVRAGFADIRLNAVAIKGMIESQVVPLVKFARERGMTLRFIEIMPLNSTGDWSRDDVLSGDRIHEIIEQEIGALRAVLPKDPAQPARDYEFVEGGSRIGFINPVSQPFCESCNRLRLTADGKIRNCLFSQTEWDLKNPLREGAGDVDLESIILECVANKKRAHGIGEPGFQKPLRAMNEIGG
jgi:GTP 3',8-cyclase